MRSSSSPVVYEQISSSKDDDDDGGDEAAAVEEILVIAHQQQQEEELELTTRIVTSTTTARTAKTMRPLEISHAEEQEQEYGDFDFDEEADGIVQRIFDDDFDNDGSDSFDTTTWLLPILSLSSVLVSLVLLLPLLFGWTYALYYLTGRIWIAFPIVAHAAVTLLATRPQLRQFRQTRQRKSRRRGRILLHSAEQEDEPRSSSRCCCPSFAVASTTSFVALSSSSLDIALLLWAYPSLLWKTLLDDMFTEPDGTFVVDWYDVATKLRLSLLVAYAIATFRAVVVLVLIGAIVLITTTTRFRSKDCPATTAGGGRGGGGGGGSSGNRHRRRLPSSSSNNKNDGGIDTAASSSRATKKNGRRRADDDYYYDEAAATTAGWTTGLVANCCRRRRTCGGGAASCSAERASPYLELLLRCLFAGASAVVAVLFLWCCVSASATFLRTNPPSVPTPSSSSDGSCCDPMDLTECLLPFPSLHHAARDESTATGWRVNLQSRYLPPLRSGHDMDLRFLNALDGFSTMGPIMFYLDGLKEAHEAGIGQLQGHPNMAKTLTPESVTLLLDVNASTLVAHSAEIDYIDPINPLVLIFPAQPLRHNNHYAVAVVNATDAAGKVLLPSIFLTTLLSTGSGSNDDDDRFGRFSESVFPSLQMAAPWLSSSGGDDTTVENLQLLFDFVTVSEKSQLGPVRKVRDATLEHVRSSSWGDWKDHVRVHGVIDGDCSDASDDLMARTVHAELDSPWFLSGYGPGYRGAFLDDAAVETGIPTTIGAAKFVVHIPCSVRAAALGLSEQEDASKPIRAIMEFGHGLFGNRGEASDYFLQKMAHDEGYVIVAMDWRGMSSFDLFVVVKTLLSKPSLFQAVRDNLIQGYANKFALQHFSQNGMLLFDWFQFQSSEASEKRTAPTLNGEPPVSFFYGISQGGILGAGYASLSGPTKLIQRAALGVPGTPFALIMTRSLDFAGYDALMLLDFYNNRHVRIFLALAQMVRGLFIVSTVQAKIGLRLTLFLATFMRITGLGLRGRERSIGNPRQRGDSSDSDAGWIG